MSIRIWGGATPLLPQTPPPQQATPYERSTAPLAAALRGQRFPDGGLCALLRSRDLLPAGPGERTRGSRALSHGAARRLGRAVRTLRAATRDDLDACRAIDATLEAMKTVKEFREGSRQMGRQTLRVAAA